MSKERLITAALALALTWAGCGDEPTAEERLKAAAPDEWKAYEAARAALRLAAPDEWKAYKAARVAEFAAETVLHLAAPDEWEAYKAAQAAQSKAMKAQIAARTALVKAAPEELKAYEAVKRSVHLEALKEGDPMVMPMKPTKAYLEGVAARRRRLAQLKAYQKAAETELIRVVAPDKWKAYEKARAMELKAYQEARAANWDEPEAALRWAAAEAALEATAQLEEAEAALRREALDKWEEYQSARAAQLEVVWEMEATERLEAARTALRWTAPDNWKAYKKADTAYDKAEDQRWAAEDAVRETALGEWNAYQRAKFSGGGWGARDERTIYETAREALIEAAPNAWAAYEKTWMEELIQTAEADGER